MTSTPVTSVPANFGLRPVVNRSGWVWIGVLGLLFVSVFHVILVKSYQFAVSDADWSHALIVPLVSLYFVFQVRDELKETPKRVCMWGLPILMFGLVGHALAIFPVQNHMSQGYNMIIALFGLVLFVLGPAAMRLLWLPVVFLGFAIKVSEKIWERIALELQLIAAKGATALIDFFGAPMSLDATVRGSIIELVYKGKVLPAMEVAQACAGLRMLMAFIALGVAVAFLVARPWWQRAIIVLSTAPIAVGVNIVRVTVIGFIYPYDQELASGDFHTLIGMLMLVPAGGVFLLLGWILDKVFVIPDSDDEGKPAGKRSAAQVKPAASEQLDARQLARRAGVGAAWGLVLMSCLGGGYLMWLSWKRPDLLSLATPTMSLLGLIGLAAVGGAGILGLPVLLRRIGVRFSLARRWTALGVSAGVLLAAVAGQSAVIAATEAVLFKKPVPLRHQLYELPKEVGSWKHVSTNPPLPDDIAEVLGTDTYISMIYEDLDYPEHEPGRRVRIHIAYYTGMIDTVPHVPDRCFMGAGLKLTDSDTAQAEIHLPQAQPDPKSDNLLTPSVLSPPERVRVPTTSFDLRRVSFDDPRSSRPKLQVLYFFIANGKYMATPEQVRMEGFNIADKYSFYCKVEVQPLWVEDPELAHERTQDLLSAMLPEIMTCLPDWVDVRAGEYPAPESANLPGD
jgi:exosortase